MKIDRRTLATAKSAARSITSGLTRSDLPVDITAIARRLGVDEIVAKRMKASGLLVAEHGRLKIFTRESDPAPRRRFTIAHELGHLLLAQAAGADVEEFHRGRSYTNEERAADRLAAELLMPVHLISIALRDHSHAASPPHWVFLRWLQSRFNVSLSAIALRTLDVDGVTAVLIRGTESAGLKVDCSFGAPVLLYERPEAITTRLLQRARHGQRPDLFVHVHDEDMQINLDHRIRDLGADREHWFIGFS